MHVIDSAIYAGNLTRDLLAEHAAQPLPPQGYSYWGDEMHAHGDPERAARAAARQMGQVLASLDSVTRD